MASHGKQTNNLQCLHFQFGLHMFDVNLTKNLMGNLGAIDVVGWYRCKYIFRTTSKEGMNGKRGIHNDDSEMVPNSSTCAIRVVLLLLNSVHHPSFITAPHSLIVHLHLLQPHFLLHLLFVHPFAFCCIVHGNSCA